VPMVRTPDARVAPPRGPAVPFRRRGAAGLPAHRPHRAHLVHVHECIAKVRIDRRTGPRRTAERSGKPDAGDRVGWDVGATTPPNLLEVIRTEGARFGGDVGELGSGD